MSFFDIFKRHPRADISAHADGQLESGRREAVETHLATCEQCRAELQSALDLRAALQGLPQADAPERIVGVGRIDGLQGSYAAAGAAWHSSPQLVEANKAAVREVFDIATPSARHLLPLARRELERGKAVQPAAVAPAYLRETVAERPRTNG